MFKQVEELLIITLNINGEVTAAMLDTEQMAEIAPEVHALARKLRSIDPSAVYERAAPASRSRHETK